MRKKLICLSIICFILGASCRFGGKRIEGNGKITSEKRTANDISKIKLAGGVNVIIDNGLAGARVEGDENIIPYIITETDGDWLKISVKKNVSLQTKQPMTVYVSTPFINEISITGSGDVIANGKFSAKDKMQFAVAGSGNITMDLNAPEVNTSISGSGTIRLTGETRSVNVEIAGSGNHDGIGLKAENAYVNVAGSGDAMVYADVKLKASIAGSGNIKYKGNASVEKNVVGSGDVMKEP